MPLLLRAPKLAAPSAPSAAAAAAAAQLAQVGLRLRPAFLATALNSNNTE